MAVPVLRNTVGARNPFAFAEIKLGKKIDWRNISAGEKKKIIERAFGSSISPLKRTSFSIPFTPAAVIPSCVMQPRSKG
jgi:hypothetical protein